MNQDYKKHSPNKLAIEDLKNRASVQIISSIASFEGTVHLTAAYQGDEEEEYLFLNFILDIPNNPVNDIRQEEPVVIVTSLDNSLPKVYASREDFPVGLPHTNVTKQQRPVSLCIFEDSFEEIKHKWSGSFFLNNIKNWLQLTSRAELHQESQPIEPFVLGSKGIVIDRNSHFIKELPNGFYTTTECLLGTPIHRVHIKTVSIENGVVHRRAENLYELDELFNSKGINIMQLIRIKVEELVNEGMKNRLVTEFWKGLLFPIVEIPILRNANEAESTVIGFKINATLGELSALFGRVILGINNILPVEENFTKSKLEKIGVEILNPHINLDKSSAQNYSGIDKTNAEHNFSLIGLGALGSQFFMNLARNGFGKWQLIDKDFMLPHNFIRHASVDINNHTAVNKANVISEQANRLLSDSEFSKALSMDIYDVDIEILNSSFAIVDMSTSIGVERYLAHEVGDTRKFSSFLNPNGTDLVWLAEDSQRQYSLDLLEVQYYKELLYTEELSGHLDYEEKGKLRYARGCRDATSKIPQENLAVFSGISSKFFKSSLNHPNAAINIWSLAGTGAVQHFHFEIDKWISVEEKGWKIHINSSCFLSTISAFRSEKLPNETGGILLGTIDTHYKTIYIIDTILAPKDSIEKPTLFIRGIAGVQQKLENISVVTNDNIGYLGEWHSHPKKSSLAMSADDRIQFDELIQESKFNGQPAIMLILGDNDLFNLYVDRDEV